ncbi:MAG: metal-dependent hydrolase [Methanomicrobiales archaeon]|nr:metal-dependent hydrolase [Methanomicrobiales archaeon]
MRRGTHLFIGALAFLAYSYLLSLLLEIPADTMLMGLFAALFGSVMPDVIDPPVHRAHRGIGHHRLAMWFSGWAFAFTAILGLFQVYVPDLSLACLASGFFLGYALHLLADATTPAGIPG